MTETVVQDGSPTEKVLIDMVGEEVAVSDWLQIAQDRVTTFGGVTLDFDPYHIDPAQAENGPFGVPAAQGFLTLSLLTYFMSTAPMKINLRHHINYGFNRIRFVRPAVIGHHLRAHFILKSVEPRNAKSLLLTFEVTVRAKESEDTVLAAEWLALILV
ncbi:MAG: MaoC/PaaZ C-terminal domain-containing protein [Pseudomonadota bacterium]